VLTGHADDAPTLIDELLALAENDGNPWLAAVAHLNVGRAARASGDVEKAFAAYHESLALHSDGGYLLGVVAALDALGPGKK
jgi:predicted TPR repeat methyltransferase